MSKIGRVPIIIPSGVSISLDDSNVLTVKGSKGELTQVIHPLVNLEISENQVKVSPKNHTKLSLSLYGTFQKLISNMVEGVVSGYQKTLELIGTGYRVQKQGEDITLSLGLSHPVKYEAPKGVQIAVEGNNIITISGIDKQVVGQAAAEIRAFRPPEPYKGKGIRYQGEVVRRKAGKAAKAGQS